MVRSRVRNHTDAHIRLSPPQVYIEKFENLRRNPHKTRVTSQSISEFLLHPSLPFILYPRPEIRGWQWTVRLRQDLGSMFHSLLDFSPPILKKKKKPSVTVGVSKSPWGQTSCVQQLCGNFTFSSNHWCLQCCTQYRINNSFFHLAAESLHLSFLTVLSRRTIFYSSW